MLIGICGGPCSGKTEVARWLVTAYAFQELRLITPDTPNGDLSPSLSPKPHTLIFTAAKDLIAHVTQRWKQHFVLRDIRSEKVLEELLSRPFFILLSIDAPTLLRWSRWQQKCTSLDLAPGSLEAFLEKSDTHIYDPVSGISAVAERASIKLCNATDSLPPLHKKLSSLNLTDPERLRPGWDAYFMQLASLAAKRSNCMKRRVGCVLVRERRVMATGYNGAPRGLTNCNEGGCERCNSGAAGGVGLATCLCIHAEENALLEAGRERIGCGAILYCDTCPCLTCSIKIVQVGISEVVYALGYSMDNQTAAVLMEGGVRLRQFVPPRDGLVTVEESEC